MVRNQQPLVRVLFMQIMRAVEHMHSQKGLCHLDLKLENVVVNANLELKLIDFAFCHDLRLPVHGKQGT